MALWLCARHGVVVVCFALRFCVDVLVPLLLSLCALLVLFISLFLLSVSVLVGAKVCLPCLVVVVCFVVCCRA